MRLLASVVLLVPAIAGADPQIVDGVTLEPIPNATYTIARGEITVEAPGYAPTTQPLAEMILLFHEDELVEVRGKAPLRKTGDATVLTRDDITALPGGGNDVLAAVRSLPGVAKAPAIAGGRLVIRGGAPQDSLLTIDGVPVPFAYHAFDNTTILPVTMIGAMAYSPGGFGVEEGRATSGAVTILTNDVPPPHATAQASISMLDVAAKVATPLAKHLYLSGGLRRSAVDVLMPLALPDDIDVSFTSPPRYYDGQIKLDWIPTSRDRVSLLVLTSYDRLGVVNHMTDGDLPSDYDHDAKFGRAIASWKHETGAVRNRLVGALGDGEFHAKFDMVQHVDGGTSLALLRDDLSVTLSDRIELRAGAIGQLQHHQLDARSILVPSDGIPPGHWRDLPIIVVNEGYDANYAAAYAATDVRPTSSTTITAGARADYFGHIHRAVLEPRIEIAQKLGTVELRAAAGRYARDLDQTQGIRTDLLPELATQVSAGATIAIDRGLSIAATAYRTTREQLAVQQGEMPTDGRLPYASSGIGSSTGIDLLLRGQRDHAFGWIAYSWSTTSRRDDAMSESHKTAFDQTHVLSAVGGYKVGAWTFGGRGQLASGMPYTDVIGAQYLEDAGRYLPILGTPYGARYPTTATIDLKIERAWKTKIATIAAFIDVTNVFRTERVQRYTYNADFTEKSPLSDFVPLPSIGVRGEI